MERVKYQLHTCIGVLFLSFVATIAILYLGLDGHPLVEVQGILKGHTHCEPHQPGPNEYN